MSIQEAKDKVAVARGYINWDNLWLTIDADVSNYLIDECMTIYGANKACEGAVKACKHLNN